MQASFLKVRPRYRFLVLHADSRAGRTSFAESRFQNPFVVTVEDNPELDLKGFDRSAHDGVVLDKCNTFGQTQRPSSFVEQVGPAATPRGAEVPPGAPPT